MPVWVRAYSAVAYACLGRNQEARAQSAEILRLQLDFSIRRFSEGEPWKDPADLEHVVDGLRKAGLPE
jgi:adenylate cyclase